MPAADDLQDLARRTNRELDALHDFFHHSRAVWESFRLLVLGGHRFVVDNEATGNTVDQDGLLRLMPAYIQGYLAAFTFRQFVSVFEVFLFAFLQRVLQHNPWQFARSPLEFEVVLKARDREEIISGIIAKQLNELKYQRPRDWFDSLNKALRLDCPSEDEVDTVAEVKATRDLLEHNAGVANEIYVRKAGTRARYVPGDIVEIDDAYHLQSWRLIKKLVEDITTAAVARLALPASAST